MGVLWRLASRCRGGMRTSCQLKPSHFQEGGEARLDLSWHDVHTSHQGPTTSLLLHGSRWASASATCPHCAEAKPGMREACALQPAFRYVLYWKKRFSEQPITDFCCVIKTNSKAPLEEQDNYFLLCDALPEDRALREKLQQQRLREVLEQQQQERCDTDFCGLCMFCDKEFTGNRSILLNHMATDHAFSVGLPDNIVGCKEFLDVLQKKLDSLQCLYCEKVFRDKNTLKDHMRKKQHRKINAKNREYDKFYIINYLIVERFVSSLSYPYLRKGTHKELVLTTVTNSLKN
uniref:Uncharacterized protein n=1 Tax=Sphaerodactylus townsendi TaxID=933632 RepID=A0ACB8FQ23_9SAUR